MTLQPGKLILAKDFRSFNPSDIETALWLDAADASTITESGGAVSQWNDKSGNGNNVSQATPANQPTYASSVINSLNVVRFTNTRDNRLATAAAILTQQSFGIYAITANRNPSGESSWAGQYIGLDIGRTLFYQNGVSTRLAAIGSGSGSAVLTGTADANFHIFGYEAVAGAGNSYTTYYEGEIGVTGTHSSNLISNTTFKIGDADAGSNDFSCQADVAEVIICLAPLSTIERQKIEGYLAHKWGLTANLPADHPYKTVEPTP